MGRIMKELLELRDAYLEEIASAVEAGVPEDADAPCMTDLRRLYKELCAEVSRLNAEAQRVVRKYQL